MQTNERRKRPMRLRMNSRGKKLICYLVSFALPLLWQLISLRWIYPYKLASTAPALPEALTLVRAPADASVRAVLAAREESWLRLLALCALAAWAVTLLMQLLWRCTHRTPLLAARATQRAVRSYRCLMLAVWALALGCAAFLWQVGVRSIAGCTFWDLLAYFGFYLLLPPAAMAVSRLAAPAVLSGRHAFFKRL